MKPVHMTETPLCIEILNNEIALEGYCPTCTDHAGNVKGCPGYGRVVLAKYVEGNTEGARCETIKYGKHCETCNGTRFIPTGIGKTIAAFMKRHLDK